ncbi:hypothetical protein BBO99_00002108 [Phytophthora kernoviae]|uniref:Ion transport domain-containing protein n=2 Tax=Phytophthora kernoviae TaxID=325452 RepID=A0A3F2RKH7_9STRA|nr:hypothetical protein G195_006610 [Phytophthora kernoviae 00238/432]KAG2521641.1 hypothetical protein JM16_003949 [Phytophthora kernoviae]KAG2523037.1 hypothetical protein JM18_005408 [Phytophthora kernoviae]RLN14768.1 hypothetical protein BBI17_002044 [Phytophthora kernoviae]RLN59179.1 hypothetical protein BBP00_00006625 [Phytophthora kernoviae]
MMLFICMPREGWSDIMYMLQDAGFTTTPSIFLVSFVLISSYFMLNLALAVIWENFSEASMVEAEQQKLKYKKKFIQRLLNHWIFSTIVTALILLNTVLLSLDQYPVDESLASTVDVINFVLTLLFLLEAVLKVFGLGFYQWSEDRYNIFDALVVALAPNLRVDQT